MYYYVLIFILYNTVFCITLPWRTLFDAAAPLLAKRGATKEQRREDFLHLRTHWLETDLLLL